MINATYAKERRQATWKATKREEGENAWGRRNET